MSRPQPPAQAAGELLQRGYRLHQQGQWKPAADLYREALRLQPRNFDALYLLGMLSLQTNDAPAAMESLSEAIAAKPDDPAAHSLLGVALQSAGKLDEALASFDHAIRLRPDSAEFHYNRGKLLRQLEQPEAAVACYDAALRLKQDYFQAWNNRGDALLALGRHEEALRSADRALQHQPQYAEALSNRGIALLALMQIEPALDSLDRALAIKPAMPGALYHRGNALVALERCDEALADYDRALALRPGWIEPLAGKAAALNTLRRHAEALACADLVLSAQPAARAALQQRGIALNALGRPADALESLDALLALEPDHAGALVDRGNVLMRLNRLENARRDYENAVRLSPDNASAHWNLCLCLLLTGEFEKGWAEYDWRWSTHLRNVRQSFDKPRWDGNPVGGRLLVWGEQGIGDQVIYASMFRETAARAPRMTVAAAPRLLPLFARSFPDIEFTTMEQALAGDAYDVQAPMGDLGRHLRRGTGDFIDNRKAYLDADPGRTDDLRKSLAGPETLVCGLSWSSSNNSVGREKSMALRDLLPALSLPGFRFIDLQYGDTTGERAGLLEAEGIEILRVESVDNWNDIDGLAALTAACDIIVTISNTTANIAGALGKQVFLMLPYSQGRFWYWQAGRDDTLWYPRVRVFRQPAEGDWASVIREVRDALAALPRPRA